MSFFKLFICLSIALSAFMFIADGTNNVVESATNTAKWQKANIPAQGAENGWLLTSGSDITCLSYNSNGILYAGVTGMPSNLYKSSDGENHWQAVGNGSDEIIDMALAADNTLYYATASNIGRCNNDSNIIVTTITGRFSEPDTVISSIDVSNFKGNHVILVGTKNQNSGQFGGVYVIYCDTLMQWQDLRLTGCDVYSVAFSPHFSEDNAIVALANDENNTFITWKEGSGNWEGGIGNALFRDSTGNPVPVTEKAQIAFPDDYSQDVSSGNCVLYAALNTGTNGGDVYIVYGRHSPEQSVAEDLDIAAVYGHGNIDITDFDLCGGIGDFAMMAGTAGGNTIYISSDCGQSWQQSKKSPSGEEVTALSMSAGYKNNGKAYCVTKGSESAFSVSLDYGVNWNQSGLIDTTIDIITETAVSPRYDFDKTLYMLTWGNQYSLWRTTDGCISWQRVFVGNPDNFTEISKIAVSPQYGTYDNVLYLCGSEHGGPLLWKSPDKGQTFFTRDLPFTVDQWAIINDSSFYIAGFDGTNTLLYRTIDSGSRYKYKSTVGNRMLTSLVLSPDYANDRTVLAGNCNGEVYLSTDEGITFNALVSAPSPLAGSISLAFDANYRHNDFIYAAGDTLDNGIYRFAIGESNSWEAIDATLPSGAMIVNLIINSKGILYAVNYQPVNAGGGMERCLDPASEHFFETFDRGLHDDTTLNGLWSAGNTVWSIDSTGNSLLFFNDTLSEQVNLSSPSNHSIVKGAVSGGNIKNIFLDWESLEGAGAYRWQISDSANFSASSIVAEDTASGGSVKLNPLETGSIYYWRIRASAPLLSPWSETWSFTPQAMEEMAAPVLESPAAGAVNVPVNTLFQWTAVNGAQSYELEISTQYDFSRPVVQLAGAGAIPVNAWQNPQFFAHNTTYYWRVRAVNAEGMSRWSSAGVFATAAAEIIQTTSSSIITTESTGVTQTQSTQSLASFTTVEVVSTAVSTEFPTITIIQTSPSTEQLQQTLAIPDWLSYALGFMAILIVVLLSVILIIVVKRR
jgi:hypothetical protein